MQNKTIYLSTLLFLALLTGVALAFLLLGDKQLKGVVINGNTNQPIPAVSLNVDKRQFITDEQGGFEAYLFERNNSLLEINAPGYFPISFNFDIPWYLKTGQLEVKLIPQGLPIQLTDAWTGKILPQAVLEFNEQTFTADQNGLIQLNLEQINPPVTMRARQPGYLPLNFQITRLPQSSSELPLQLKLEPNLLSGQVLASDNHEPLSGVTIMVDDSAVETDANGQFKLNRLLPQTKIAIVPDKRFEPTTLVYQNQASAVVYVDPKELTVTVYDSFSGLPVSNAEINIEGNIVKANKNGQAILKRVSAEGNLLVSHTSYLSQTVAYNSQTPPQIFLNPSQIQGVIRDSRTGEALTGAEISINDTAFPLGKNGAFQLNNLNHPAVISVSHSGYKQARVTATATAGGIEFLTNDLNSQPCQTQPQNGPPLCLDLLLEPFTARAIYIPFNLLSSPETIYDLFDLVDRTELNAVIVDVKGDQGYLAWDSNVAEANALGIDGDRAGWMTLDTFVKEAQAREIYTIARMVIFKDNTLSAGYPYLAATYADGTVWLDGEGLGWANPFRQEVWTYNIELAKEVAAIGFNEINLDYIRFPSDGNLSAIAYAETNTLETRTTAIRSFAQQMNEALKPYGVALSADVFGLTVWVEPENDMNIGQRVIDIAPYVDYISPMIYPSTFLPGNIGLADPSSAPYEVIYQSVIAAQESVPASTKIRPWLQGYWYSSYEMLLQKQAANDANSDGWLWWNAAGVYDESIFELE